MAARKAVSTGTRFKVFKRDNFKCQYCGLSPATVVGVILHVDHRMPVAHGGSNDIDNLVTACSQCNLGKAAKPLEEPVTNWQDEAIRVCGLLKDAHWIATQEYYTSERTRLDDLYASTEEDQYCMSESEFLFYIDDIPNEQEPELDSDY